MPFDEPIECPLCMEPLDIDDLNFYPCTCGYQICRFCWHRIRTDENSLCPACRKQYQEDPAEFKPLTEEELSKIKKERRQKDVARKQKAAENRRHLANIRVVQKNLVFVVGLSTRLADTEVLKRQEFFGKYGKILKVVINSSTSYAGAQGPSASAYITYTKPEDCLRAISAVNNLYVDGRTLKASLGTTKYCSHFLKGTQCTKSDCMYLHELGDEEASFTKEEMQSGKHQDYEQKLVDTYLTPSNSHPPSLTTQLSKSSSDGTHITNGGSGNSRHGTARKKTDSGSSGSSSKHKEPWPLLNSNKNANHQNTAPPSKDSSGGGDTVISSGSSPGSSTKHTHDTANNNLNSTLTDNVAIKQNGVINHSSPSSSCSTSSNPRTPTPEAMSSISPRISSTLPPPTVEERISTTTTITTVPSNPITQQQPALPSKPLLAVRKLPFSESPVSDAADGFTLLQNSSQINTNSENTIASTNKAPRIDVNATQPNTFGLSALSKDNNPLLTTTGSSVDWQTTPFDHAALALDDDLGFDPFIESNKGLADMLEHETNGYRMSPLPGFGGGLGLPMHQHRLPPGVSCPPHVQQNIAAGDMFGAGIMSSIVNPSSNVLPSSVISNNASSTLPPPPPGLPAFPQYSHDTGIQSSNNPAINNNGSDLPNYPRSRMLGLMNLGQNVNLNQPALHLMPQSPIKPMPRSPYTDGRMGSIQPPTQPQLPLGSGFPNGLTDANTFNTQELRDSLKALMPNAQINFAPNSQHLQHSRLRNNYMQPVSTHNNTMQPVSTHNNTSSWNGSISQPQQMPGVSSSAVDEQFSDPAIVSGVLSLDTTGSPPGSQPHWLKSIQQLTEIDPSPVKMPSQTMHSIYRPAATHSRMPFAQNIHMNQQSPNSGSGWPPLQAHNPPPGFQSNFRSSSQNPHMATLES